MVIEGGIGGQNDNRCMAIVEIASNAVDKVVGCGNGSKGDLPCRAKPISEKHRILKPLKATSNLGLTVSDSITELPSERPKTSVRCCRQFGLKTGLVVRPECGIHLQD